jgi:hypothetical protein
VSCAEPCPGGCDLACETRVTWKPDPRRQHPGGYLAGRTSSTRFRPDGKGGGDVEVALLTASGALGIWKRVARKRPMTAA